MSAAMCFWQYNASDVSSSISLDMASGRSHRNRSRGRLGGFSMEPIGSRREQESAQLSFLTLFLTAFRRSLFTCKAASTDISVDISCPTNVRHVAHVTFDRFNGFLGLPDEFQVEIPTRVPSASANVFGVSAESMQCSYDRRGNSVPNILLLIQNRLYRQGGLQVEGIFRINAENSHEEQVREQLNKGVLPDGVDLHCLAGLIKAWFRELPQGILDSLSPEQIMLCSTEQQCFELVKQLPSMDAALLHWALDLMADVAQQEEANKMNAHNIAMVFAPNMTKMSDPLTALMHAVRVMNFLKTLVLSTLREREEAALGAAPFYPCAQSPFDDDSGSPFLHITNGNDDDNDDEELDKGSADFCHDPLLQLLSSPDDDQASSSGFDADGSSSEEEEEYDDDEEDDEDDLRERFLFDLDERESLGGGDFKPQGLEQYVVSPRKTWNRGSHCTRFALVFPEEYRGQQVLSG